MAKSVNVVVKWHPKKFLVGLDANVDNRLRQASSEYKEVVKGSFGQPGKPKVVTGNLKRSISSGKVDKSTYRVGTGVNYALDLEYGTSKMAKRPFFRPTIVSFIGRLKSIFRGK